MIHIIDNYYVKVTKTQYIALAHFEKEDEKTKFIHVNNKILGYYSNFTDSINCIKHNLEKKKLMNCNDISEAIFIIKQTNDEFTALLKNIIKENDIETTE